MLPDETEDNKIAALLLVPVMPPTLRIPFFILLKIPCSTPVTSQKSFSDSSGGSHLIAASHKYPVFTTWSYGDRVPTPSANWITSYTAQSIHYIYLSLFSSFNSKLSYHMFLFFYFFLCDHVKFSFFLLLVFKTHPNSPFPSYHLYRFVTEWAVNPKRKKKKGLRWLYL